MRDTPKLWSAVAALGLFTMVAFFYALRPGAPKPEAGDMPVVDRSHSPAGPESIGTRIDRGKTPSAGRRNASNAPLGQPSKAMATRPAPDWGSTPADQMSVIHFPDPEKVGPYADRPTPGMAQFGEPASARVTVAGKSFALTPNQVGEFQRVYVAQNSRVAAEITYPGAGNGAPVFAEVLDGGRFADGSQAKRLVADARGRIGFDFQTADEHGTYRVLLRLGDDEKTLEFWVGAPTPVRGLARQ